MRVLVIDFFLVFLSRDSIAKRRIWCHNSVRMPINFYIEYALKGLSL